MTVVTEQQMSAERADHYGGRLKSAVFSVWFIADLRALAAMRIGLGLCALYDLLARLPLISIVYGGHSSPIRPIDDAAGTLNLLWGGHSEWFAWLLLLLGLLAAGLFTVGRWTRYAQGALLLVLLSFHAPCFGVTLSGGSTVLRQVLFIALFLPLAERWSWDRRRLDDAVDDPLWAVSWAYLALSVQAVIIYLNTAFNKDGPSWSQGTSLIDVLTLETRVTWFGRLIRPYIDVDLSVVLTHGALVFELVAPIFLLLPLAHGRLRRWVAGALIGFHLSIWLMIDVAHFSPVMIAVLLAFIGSPVTKETTRRHVDSVVSWWRLAPMFVLLWFCIVPALRSNGVTTSTMREMGVGHDPVTNSISALLSWEQDWAMFSPSVPRFESLLVVRGRTASGTVVDPFVGGRPHEGVFRQYPFTMHESLGNRLLAQGGEESAERFRAWLTKRWNADHSDALMSTEVVILKQIIRRPDEEKASHFIERRLAGP